MRIRTAISSAFVTVLAVTMVLVVPVRGMDRRLVAEGGVEHCGFFAEKSVQEDCKSFIRLYEEEVTAAYKNLAMI